MNGAGAPPSVDVDADLVEALRVDDPGGAEQLVERFGPRVYRLALRIVGGSEDAERVAQAALCRAVGTVHTFPGGSVFAAWVYRLTVDEAYRRMRRRPRAVAEIALDDVIPPLDDDDHWAPMDDWSSRVDRSARASQLREAMTRAVDELPVPYRTVLALHDVEGVSSRDIADALDMTVAGVKSQLHRSRLFLRKRLSESLEFWPSSG